MTLATISVVSHGHGPLLRALLGDLAKQQGISRCLVIVTLNLRDEVFEADKHLKLRIKVVRNHIPNGFGANHNAAFQHAEGNWFIVLNPDIRLPESDTLLRLTTASKRAVGLRAPVVINSEGRTEDSIRYNLTPFSLLRRAVGPRRTTLDLHRAASHDAGFYWVAGMFLVLAREAFEVIGGFDEKFFLYCEDYDLCARLHIAGYTMLVDDSVKVIHDAQRDSHRSGRHLRWHLASLLKVWTSRAFWHVSLLSRVPSLHLQQRRRP